MGFGCAHIGQGLTGLGLRAKDDKVHGMAIRKRDPHFAFAFKAPDPRAVPGAWVDDDVGAAVLAY